jgi:UDP-glucose 4-epimerase
VLDVVHAASDAIGRELPYVVGPRRPGDAVAVWADPGLAASMLGWRATRTLTEMCADHWRWQSTNPDGYRSA